MNIGMGWRDGLRADNHRSRTLFPKFDGVPEQIQQNLPKPAGVADDSGRDGSGEAYREVQPLGTCLVMRLASRPFTVSISGNSIRSNSSFFASIFEKSRMSFTIVSSER